MGHGEHPHLAIRASLRVGLVFYFQVVCWQFSVKQGLHVYSVGNYVCWDRRNVVVVVGKFGVGG
jgi:hypothetical protein